MTGRIELHWLVFWWVTECSSMARLWMSEWRSVSIQVRQVCRCCVLIIYAQRKCTETQRCVYCMCARMGGHMASMFNAEWLCVCAAPWWTGLTGITHAAAWPLNEPELLCSRVALTGSLQDGCFFKNQINDGYQAYSAIYHEEYYLSRPCMAVTGEPGREEAGWKALDRHSLCDGWLSALSECY